MIYDDIKAINPKKELVALSILFDWLNKGRYYITIDALDNVNNKSAMEFLQVDI